MTDRSDCTDSRILASWRTNAGPWTRAVREQGIASRRLVTDAAVLQAISSLAPANVLDIGCGEGWLARAMSERGAVVTGIDATPELVSAAAASGGGEFRLLSYEQMDADSFDQAFDLAVCNFSLLGKESVEHLFSLIPVLLKQQGHFIVQTVHPVSSCGDLPYTDGWRHGSWAGFDASFTDPAPWYFRTVESWLALFSQNGMTVSELMEPSQATNVSPVSLLMVAKVAS